MTDAMTQDTSSEDERDPVVAVCQGPPVCLLTDNAAVMAARNGCPWCERIIVHEDGTTTTHGPAHG